MLQKNSRFLLFRDSAFAVSNMEMHISKGIIVQEKSISCLQGREFTCSNTEIFTTKFNLAKVKGFCKIAHLLFILYVLVIFL